MIIKQGIDISFAQGLDTKTDPKRVQAGKFLQLQNTIFEKGGLLQKRNGYAELTYLPDNTYSYLTTLNGNLTAIGQRISALNNAGMDWIQRGQIQPLSVATLPIIRNNLNQTAVDSCVAPSGLVCTVYTEYNGSITANKYVVTDATTGQNISAPALVPVSSGTVSGGMRVFLLGVNFILMFTNTISGTAYLQYVVVNATNPSIVSTNYNFGTIVTSNQLAWDAVVVGSNLYVAFYTSSSPTQTVQISRYSEGEITSGGEPTISNFFTGFSATIISVTADVSSASPNIFVSIANTVSTVGFNLQFSQYLALLYTADIFFTAAIVNLASAAQNGSCTVFDEVAHTDSNTGLVCNYIEAQVVTVGTAASSYVLIRSLGLASKGFIVSGVIYVLGTFSSTYQKTYFLINGSKSTASSPLVAAKIAYQNGWGYLGTGIPSVSIIGSTAYIGYLYADMISAVNKTTNIPANPANTSIPSTQIAGVYSQYGINLASFDFGTQNLDTAEIANVLQISGGFLWLYDGYLPVEHNFFLYPDVNQATPTDTAVWAVNGGSVAAKPDGATNTNAYYVQFTYEWTDNQGNAYRSAPSIPIAITTTGSGTSGSLAYNVPTLRVTMKTANPVKICAYRWSVAQQIYYQTTSITVPYQNITTQDSIQIVDTNSDAQILGNNILYTTGGVVEDVNAPASNVITLFDTRLWLVDAEDPNLLWYSKQVIEATPVEMSDLFTLYIPPSTSTQGTTGPIESLQPMDDKLIIGKANALFYINGTGPDNTGANIAYSPATFITSSVGCANQNSWVLTPQGLMFQSDKGIWLLGRGLDTSYIGAPVEDFVTGNTVLSAVNVPETNQVRFTLSSGVTLMYDYYYGQWGTFTNVPAVSSCVFQDLHTFINGNGAVYQESPGLYLDGSSPTLIKFETGWIRLGDLQNYQRAYFFYLLGQYISPHQLFISIAYDYEQVPSQAILVQPTNYSTPFGSGVSQSPFGQQSPFGGPPALELWRVFLERQRCMAISITVEEVFDASFGVAAGGGFTLSGINMVLGFKKAFRPQPASETAG